MNGAVRQTVAFADTDAGGIMYHGRYIELAERSRLQWVLERLVSFKAMAEDHDTLLVLHALDARFHRPARLEDALEATTFLVDIGAARGRFKTVISCRAQAIATVTAEVVAISAARKQLSRFPETLIACFTSPVLEPQGSSLHQPALPL